MPTSAKEDEREWQRIYDRGVYAALGLLFWFVLFLEIKTPWMGFIVSTLLSTVLMSMYSLFLRALRKSLEKRVKNVSLKKWIPFAATIAYEVLPLWAARNAVPWWMLLLLATVMTIYYGFTLRASDALSK